MKMEKLKQFIQECKNDWETQSKKNVHGAIASNVSKYMYSLEQLLEPPTEQEVCEALSEHLGEKIVYEGFSLHNVNRSRGVCALKPKNKEIEIYVELPVHLIIMIGRFYEKVINNVISNY